jgi:phosphocarrier protein HPr
MKNGTATEQGATGAIVIAHEVGLHARPSVKLTKLAKTFTSNIELGLTEEGPWIDAKSIVKVMAFKAAKGSTLHFRAQGGDAPEAVTALVDLVRRDFDESHGGG